VSEYSDVDAATEAHRLIEHLDESAIGLAAMKHYMAVTHALRRPTAPVLDLGCGAGHDLALHEVLRVATVGVDPSSVMLDAAATRSTSPLVRATGEHLPFAAGAFAGCRIERVLMHVDDPARVLSEVVRCVRPSGLLTIFEPDWTSLTITGPPVPAEWVSIARHPAIGSSIGDLLHAAACSILDRVEEHSWWSHSDFERILQRSLDRAVASGHASRAAVQKWLAEQRRRATAGDFRAEITKILWVAAAPA
jgi:SAM-dependent methyltransferase